MTQISSFTNATAPTTLLRSFSAKSTSFDLHHSGNLFQFQEGAVDVGYLDDGGILHKLNGRFGAGRSDGLETHFIKGLVIRAGDAFYIDVEPGVGQFAFIGDVGSKILVAQSGQAKIAQLFEFQNCGIPLEGVLHGYNLFETLGPDGNAHFLTF